MNQYFHLLLPWLLWLITATSAAAADVMKPSRKAIAAEVLPIQRAYGIPGMAVGVTVDGRHYVFNYGVMSRSSKRPVTDQTLFELGSISKTFTASLAALAEVRGFLAPDTKAAEHLPELSGTPIGAESMLALATHTTGGMPLQIPDEVQTEPQLLDFCRDWRPTHAPGQVRTYSNLGTGVLGRLAARSLHGEFRPLMQEHLLGPLNMQRTVYDVPTAAMSDYAQGYTKLDVPIRVAKGGFDAESYGLKSTAVDLLRYLDAHIGAAGGTSDLHKALARTQVGHYSAGAMVQALVWEQYAFPLRLREVVDGSSSTMVLNAVPVTRLTPPHQPGGPVYVHKTGSTNGFGAYLAFLPQQKVGVVILANKFYPNEVRIRLAERILNAAQPSKKK